MNAEGAAQVAALEASLATDRDKSAPPSAVHLALDGVHCARCENRLRDLIGGRIATLELDLVSRTAALTPRAGGPSLAQLLLELKNAGFEPRVLGEDDPVVTMRPARRRDMARIGVAIIGAMQVMMFAWPSYFDGVPDPTIASLMRWAQFAVAIPVVAYAGWPFLAGAARTLRARTLTMDVPVALSLVMATAVSAWRTFDGSGPLYFDTATMFVALLLTGRHFESATRAQATQRLRQLAEGPPATARRIEGDEICIVKTLLLSPGDRVSVAPGEALPVDGQVEQPAEFDESLLTGESRPVTRARGDTAFAGSLNVGASPIVLRTLAGVGRTRSSEILHLLRRAAARKPAVQQRADQVAGWFTLAVLVLAAAGAALAARSGADAALSVALAVLVASCPCALSLAVPACLAAATSRLAAHGVLVTRADRLLKLAQADTALLDKTGTLTHARLHLDRIDPLRGATAQQVLRIASSLESGLRHPIALAFFAAASGSAATQVRVEAGRGVEGFVDGRRYRIGPATERIAGQDDALTWITLSDEQGSLAHFGLSAPVRDEAFETIDRLDRLGLRVELLTGDTTAPARRIASALRIPKFAAGQTPEDKLARLRALQAQGGVVLCVGDGLNDAPFLAAADASFAMPGGSAVAQARADFVLVSDRLDGLPLAIDVARQVRKRIRQNLAWAALYNLSVLPLAMVGWLPPWLAAAGMSLSSLVVVANAMRLRLPEKK
ncbi:Cu2+-exporting ATPase [Panacagrimonas perspica]|uniref:Cu2+-exporting ATPase n=1 Tax=Panacagrimonas perspica TaxID=381431 RepID=A0A4S3K4W7_9GAMM|nr:cation-translocating P-type ATPase [Panacagrimonas perspica]TDU31647.1 Cu2+-exporting ATPase [Panacagrimonas perspica]THD03129.1 cadmium-translocating P-type ATPase [Panacagrimonas perspica]